jgi:hypothetical protein
MKCRVRDVEAGILVDDGLFESRCVWTRGRKWDAGDLDVMRPKTRLEIEIAGIVDQYRVTGLQ